MHATEVGLVEDKDGNDDDEEESFCPEDIVVGELGVIEVDDAAGGGGVVGGSGTDWQDKQLVIGRRREIGAVVVAVSLSCFGQEGSSSLS